ncbi:caspase family protein [Nocardia abscessus]|uniref:caspase family protein n=1 Tax=Nocardia abscessus TaxID=120957 RepID=UPI00245563CA|nr:caspase family protein [Nocardia abscessus]
MPTDHSLGPGTRRFLIAAAVAEHARGPQWDRPGLAQARAAIVELFTETFGYTLVPTLGMNPTAAQLLDALDAFCSSPDRRPDDIVAVYFTGHGERLIHTDDHVLYTADTDPARIRLATTTATVARTILYETPVRRLLLMLDTCFSGKGGADFTAAALGDYTHHWDEAPGNGIVVISSAQPHQMAETGEFPRLFTEAVQSLSAVSPGSGTIAVQALVTKMNALATNPGWQAVGSNEVRLIGTAPAFLPSPRHGHVLPGACELWMNRLARRSSNRAAAAKVFLTELRESGGSIATCMSQMLHRPPAWLCEDDAGDGWALVACLASLSESKVAWQAFEKAADAAKCIGDLDASAYCTVTARLQQIAGDLDQDAGDEATEPDLSALEDFDDDVLARLGSVVDVYRAFLEKDLAKVKVRAETAVASLGLTDPYGVLCAPAEPVPVVEFDSDLRNLVVATMLRQLALSMLAPGAADQLGIQSGLATRALRGNPVTRDLADDGMRLAQWAVQLCPKSQGARLTLAQTTLAVVVSTSGRSIASNTEDEVSLRAREIENDAMSVRNSLNDWGGSTGDALAVAARARSIQGDFTGALRMLRPDPDGDATHTEARHPEVIRLSAFLARVVGNDDLALELAANNPNRAEGQIMRAAVLDRHPQTASEAKVALFTALEISEGNHHNDFQALMALSRRFNSLDETEKATVTTHITRLGELDPDLAEVMNARVLMSQGEYQAALQCVRGLERNELALEAHSDALIAVNRAEEAARLVFTEGVRRGDILLATEALELAMDNGLDDIAHELALKLLVNNDSKPVRLKVLRALRRIARTKAEWSDAATWTNRIIQELDENDLRVPEAEYWQLAEALYFQERIEKALTVLLEAPTVTFAERDKALLFLSIISRAIDEQHARTHITPGPAVADLGTPKVHRLFMRAAADWSDDEQIAAAAMSVALTAPGSTFTESQIADMREYADKYFERHGENGVLTRVSIENNNLEPLIEILRRGAARQQALEELAERVRSGEVPLAVLAEAAGRTTTESLIRHDLGYILAIEDDAGLGEQTAHAALDGRVVADTTAVVVAPWSGRKFKKLAANFDAVIIPAPLREDIARARSSLARQTTATLSWDTRAQRPSLTTIPPELARAHAEVAERVWADAQGLQIAPFTATHLKRWHSAIAVARELGVAVWADDNVIRRLARATGVQAFGSLDLIRVISSHSEISSAVAGFRASRVVDVLIDQPWYRLAEEAEWRIDSPFAIAISRPTAWRNSSEAFAEFQSLIRSRPQDMDPNTLADWAHLAANGLAMATVPTARHRAVSSLLAWTIVAADPFFAAIQGIDAGDDAKIGDEGGKVTERIIIASDLLCDRYYPAADGLALLVDLLCVGLLNSVEPDLASRIIVNLVQRLDRTIGSRVFAAYIQSAGN